MTSKFDKDKLLNATYNQASDSEALPPGAITNSNEVEEAFNRAFDAAPDHPFLLDVYDFWETKGFLTESQYEAVCKFVRD